MDAVAEKGQSVLRILCSDGDRRLVWRKESQDEVREAKKAFNEALAKKGNLAYAVSQEGERSQKITEFDPEAEEIVIVPMITGG
jgi:hypothetical protein